MNILKMRIKNILAEIEAASIEVADEYAGKVIRAEAALIVESDESPEIKIAGLRNLQTELRKLAAH